MKGFGSATRAWFERSFGTPTRVQSLGWPRIAAGENALLIAPTGSGKTLAAFLWCIDRLIRTPATAPGVQVLYVSPLKALVYDVERNLRAPVAGIAREAEVSRVSIAVPKVAIRTGDTPSAERQRQLREPGDILVTTPESLYLLLTSQARDRLRTVQTVIVDEVHALAPNKRGAHLALSLERLSALCDRDPQRVGLSATAKPLEEVARFLGGDREVSLVDTSEPPNLRLRIVVPVPDMTRPHECVVEGEAPPSDDIPEPAASSQERTAASSKGEVSRRGKKERGRLAKPEAVPAALGRGGQVQARKRIRAPAEGSATPGMGEPLDNSIWPTIYPRLLELIAEHRTTIIFVNSRGLCERLAQRLTELAGDESLVRSHHGSIARAQREQIEEMLKAGEIRAIVATSSLELGIDMGTVDLVVLVESPGAVSRGLQRVGRAGHGVGQESRGEIFPKHRGDLLETAVVARRMTEGAIEALRLPRNPLDVLAQQVVAMCAVEPWTLGALERVVRRAASFRDLPADALTGVVDMLTGKYPSHAFADLRPRLVWDRETDTLTARRGSKLVAIQSGGTIPDRGTFAVYLGDDGPRVGELDEEMVHESAPGQNIMLGASTWRIENITRDRVIVSPAPGESGRLPFWRGDGPGRPAELGRALGAFVEAIGSRTREEAEAWLQEEYPLDPLAARNLVTYVFDQREATGSLPTHRAITIERFRDELGDWRVCIHCSLGSRVNAPWALALQARLEAHFGFEVQAMWSDDGIVLRLVEVDALPEIDVLLPDPHEVEELLLRQLAHSALFAGQFRENAGRALLLPRPRAGGRTPLWQQRLKAQQLLAVAREYPSFPIIIETYRACLEDVFDLPALVELLGGIQSRKVRIDLVETTSPSPFARSLLFAYVAAYLYEGDAPLAERKAQALALDRKLLRELLGQEELRDLLDAGVIGQLEHELQGLDTERKVQHVDALHDLLRRVGELDVDELAARCVGDPGQLVEALVRGRRAVWMPIAGVERLVAVEDVGLLREALGVAVPPGVPGAFLERVPDAWEVLVARYARTHGPFAPEVLARRYGVPVATVTTALRLLESQDKVVQGAFHPDGTGTQFCDAEVLRRIKRRTLSRLRGEIAPVEPRVLARFLPAWHGIGDSRIGLSRLEEAIGQLEGLPLSYDELERVILPARVPGFAPRLLDELGAMGWLVWVGHGALGRTDGRVALYRRERVSQLLEPPEPPDDLQPIHRTLLEHLDRRGACFYVELQSAAEGLGTSEEIRQGLWDLVWWGLVTNDTFAALRGYAVPARARVQGRGRDRRSGGPASPAFGGRWARVADLLSHPTTATDRAYARANMLLERHGIVSRELGAIEALPGGFSPLYQVLRAMEEAGKIRRGYFVEGLGGAQFASPGAVDRLRSLRAGSERGVVVHSAIDPANPYGGVLPWPTRQGTETETETGAGPRRVAGATVVTVGGEPALYLDKGSKRLVTFPAADDPETAVLAARGLADVARRRRGKLLRIETIDGAPARTSPHAERLRAASFTSDPRGLILEVS